MNLWIEKNRIISFILTALIAVEIFFFSTVTGGRAGTAVFGVATVYHFIAFFLLGFFLFSAIKGKTEIKTSYIFIVIMIAVLYAVSDEIHQIFVPLRDASLKDILIDSTGIFSAVFLRLFMEKKKATQDSS